MKTAIYIVLKRPRDEKEMDMIKGCIKQYMTAILFSFMYILLFSQSTSPLYGFRTTINDSYIFQIIGKYWDSTCIPYIGLFDHKGPMIFFINKVGYMLTNNQYGIFIIQVINMSFAIAIMLRLFQHVFSPKGVLLAVIVTMTGFIACYEFANLTEEYILPFLMASFSNFWIWIDEYMTKRQVEHEPISAFAFNISYVSSSQGVWASMTIYKALRYLAVFFSSYSMMFVGILVWIKKKRWYMGAFMTTLSFVTTVMFVSGRLYAHYNMICLPYFVISMIELKKLHDPKMKTKIVKMSIIVFSIIFTVTGLYSIGIRYKRWCQTEGELSDIDRLVSSISDDDKERFIAWSCPPYLYLKHDIKPFYKYFILQNSHAKINEKIKNDIQETFKTGGAEWILVKDGTQELIQDILENRYALVGEQSDSRERYLLYQKEY